MYFYVHIPFCRQKCPYCKFALTPFVQEAKIANYLGFLMSETDRFFESGFSDRDTVESIYFGGGTPSVLSPEQIGAILARFPVGRCSKNAEITIETNPEDITEAFVRGIMDLGVNRLSLGVQSLNDETLKAVHRSDSDTVFRALDAVGRAGFPNVNVDFIIGLPHVPEGGTLLGIRALHERYPFLTHTSAYYLEKGDYPKEWKWLGIGEEAANREYADIVRYLTETRWFQHYEVSNFGKPGYESVHNRAYWTHGNVQGFGLSAASFLNGERFENAHSFAWYYRGEVVNRETVSPAGLRLESGMFGLRTFALDPSLVSDPEKALVLEKDGLLERHGGLFRSTLAWIFVLDHIMSELL